MAVACIKDAESVGRLLGDALQCIHVILVSIASRERYTFFLSPDILLFDLKSFQLF